MTEQMTAAPGGDQVKMSTPGAPLTHRQAAAVAGVAYVLIIVLGGFSTFFVFGRVVQQTNAAGAVSALLNPPVLFGSGVAAFVATLIADVVVAWGLYVLFQGTSRELSLFVAWFRVVYVAIAAAALLNLVVAFRLADGAGYASALEAVQRNAQVMVSVDAFQYGWRVGLVFFGVHLLLLGFVMVRSDYAPSLLGRLVSLAGLAYAVNNLAFVLLAGHQGYGRLIQLVLTVLAVPGEFGLVGWLLWRAMPGSESSDREASLS